MTGAHLFEARPGLLGSPGGTQELQHPGRRTQGARVQRRRRTRGVPVRMNGCSLLLFFSAAVAVFGDPEIAAARLEVM